MTAPHVQSWVVPGVHVTPCMTTGGTCTFMASTGNLYPNVIMDTAFHAGILVGMRVMNTLLLMVPVIVGTSMADGTMVHRTSSMNDRMGYHATLPTTSMSKSTFPHVENAEVRKT